MVLTDSNSTQTDYKVLVVDDDETMRYVISRVIARCDCAVQTATTPDEALAIIGAEGIDLVFSDLRIPGTVGGEGLLQAIVKRFPDTTVILMSCGLEEEKRLSLMQQGAFDCLRKPFFEQECQDVLTRLSNPDIGRLRKAG